MPAVVHITVTPEGKKESVLTHRLKEIPSFSPLVCTAKSP